MSGADQRAFAGVGRAMSRGGWVMEQMASDVAGALPSVFVEAVAW